MVTFDVPHIFRVSGGPRGLLDWMDRHKQADGLHYNTVQMWSHRGTIPTRWVGAVLYVVEQEGHSCREFLTDNDEFVGP